MTFLFLQLAWILSEWRTSKFLVRPWLVHPILVNIMDTGRGWDITGKKCGVHIKGTLAVIYR